MNNLHISLTEFKNETRVLKETFSLIKKNTFEVVYIAALHSEGLLVEEPLGEKLLVNRFILKTRAWSKSYLVQVIKYLELCTQIYIFYRKKNIDVVNVHSLGLLPLGVALKFLYKSKLVYDAHELETEVDYLAGIKKNFNKFVERFCIPHVDVTIVVSDSIADWYTKEYEMTRPTVVLNAPPHREILIRNYFREQLNIRADQKILLYQGGLVTGRGISLILDAFKVRSDDRIVAVFMGYGPLEADIIEASSQYKNIFFYPAVSPEIVLEYTASADIGISLIENTCLSYYYCMPNKIFEYAMAGLPVLVSNMKDMSELVKKNAMGAVIKKFSPDSINIAIDNLLAADLKMMSSNAYQMACSHAWEKQEAAMFKAYSHLNLIKAS
jgi:glycosyltransferase involved in cell wall biosynthesis